VVVISLIKEDIFPVLDSHAVGSVLFQNPCGADSVFFAELLPELGSDYLRKGLLWLPHCPIWMVMISRGIIQII